MGNDLISKIRNALRARDQSAWQTNKIPRGVEGWRDAKSMHVRTQ